MKLGVLFSGGKDSTLAAFLAKKQGHELACLISLISDNKDSFMFHTPNIAKVKEQSEVMEIPLVTQKTEGKKEFELNDLKEAIQKAKDKFQIEGVVTGAIESVYQSSRIQKICNDLGIECFNPLWQKEQFELLNDLIDHKFKVIITGVFAEPFNSDWLERPIDKDFIEEMREIHEVYKINPAGEGGELESFVLDCPLFTKALEITDKKISGEKHSWRLDIEVKEVKKD